MASTSTTETWDAAWTLTLRAHRKRLTDNFFDSYPTLNSLRQGNALEVESGGKEIQEDLLYGGNTAEFFSGYDVLNTDSVDGITAAFFPWRYCAVPITISMTEEQENKKSDAALKLLAAKTEQSVLTMSDQINNALYSAQTGKSILGFQDIIADAPSSSPTTLGGITVSGNSWWQNKANNATSDTSFQTISNSHFYEGMLRIPPKVTRNPRRSLLPPRFIPITRRFSREPVTSACQARTSRVLMVVCRHSVASRCSTTVTAVLAGCISSILSISS